MAGNICCYHAPNDPASFFCVPDKPTTDRDDQGRPVLMLIANGAQTQLQMSVRWSISPAELSRLPEQIAHRFPTLRPEAIRLMTPMVEVTSVSLLLGDGEEDARPLGDFHSSGMPPYSTVIRMSLTEQQRASVVAALQKRPGFALIRYEISLPVEVSATTRIKGDVETELAQVRFRAFVTDPSPGMIEQALEAGHLAQSTSTIGPASDALIAATAATARQKAITAFRSLNGNGSAHLNVPVQAPSAEKSMLDVSATQAETIRLKFSPTADVSSWFDAPVDIIDHLLIQPGGGPTPVTGPVSISVALAFDASDTPINFILIKQGAQQATLTGPAFEPVTLKLASGEALEVITRYTDGGPPFSQTLDEPSTADLQLGPSNVGLVAITLDANLLAEAGLKAARVRIRYIPDDTGSEDDRTIHLRNREWFSTWYAVSRAATLAGTLRYECKLTAANGTITNIAPEEVTTPTIILHPGILNS